MPVKLSLTSNTKVLAGTFSFRFTPASTMFGASFIAATVMVPVAGVGSARLLLSVAV
ncbi:hypothetical protein D9M70_539730 [compost metagenome]